MICNCSMVGTMVCKTCQRYKEYLVEEKSITQLAKEKEQANYEAWRKNCTKIEDMRGKA